ncbi:MAG: adenylyl-sulfate kinase [Betaproteobacteria bacterium]|nr:adenylyl-sulfate kinase [Betaproteobacteria bacterium]
MNESGKPRSPDVVWHHATVTRERREKLQGHRGVVLWFTGLPSSGKSTIAHAVEERLHQTRCRTIVLDGDNIRHGLCGDLGFSAHDREENIRRIGEVAKLFVEGGTVVLTAFVSPFRRDRERARGLLLHGDFLEIHCRCPVEVCEQRDPKGHYQRAKEGQLKDFTGVSAPYEEPSDPELALDTARLSIEESVEKMLTLLRDRGVIR